MSTPDFPLSFLSLVKYPNLGRFVKVDFAVLNEYYPRLFLFRNRRTPDLDQNIRKKREKGFFPINLAATTQPS